MKIRRALSFVAILITSCVSEDVLHSEQSTTPLRFSTDYTPTRGALIEDSDDMESIGIYGYDVSQQEFNDDSSTPDFMYNVELSRFGDEWVYSPLREWGDYGYDALQFFAYAPYASSENGITPSEESVAGAPYLHYDMCVSVVDQPDIMVAEVSVNRATGYVNLNFVHALAAINFTLSSTESCSVDSLVLRGIVGSADLSMQLADDGTPQWSNLSEPNNVEHTVLFQDDDNQYNIMAIPQAVTSSAKIYLYVNGQIRDFTFPSSTQWLSGEIYTYNVSAEGGVVELSGVENCYIVNPSLGGQFNFDGVTRVNQFWGSKALGGVDSEHLEIASDGAGYLSLGSAANAIAESDEWYVELIWADFDDVAPITFAQSKESYGVGDERVQFTLNTSSHGNLLIGMRRRDNNSDKYLWSWHLWLTDYDPQNPTTHIYTPEDECNGYYNNGREIMDRNLGATDNIMGSTGAYGLYYQWGRKDPFYGSGCYYGGADVSQPELSETVFDSTYGSYLNCFYYPSKFYYTKVFPFDPYCSGFASLTGDDYNRWGGTESSTSTTAYENDKTIYDPCPEGWRVPSGSDWSGLDSESLIITDSWGDYNGNAIAPAGSRLYSSSSLSNRGSAAYYWSASPDEPVSSIYVPAHILTFGSSMFGFDNDALYFKTSGYSIRPMKIKQ